MYFDLFFHIDTRKLHRNMTEMTKPLLRKLCKDKGLYTTPDINDKLYLHYQGFSYIQNLEEYTGLKALWLEGNGLAAISGLEKQTELRSLYLHENLIERIENLDSQTELDCLNLSKNYISSIDNLSHMTKLSTLNLANNHIKSADGIRHILQIPSLQTLDIQHNKIEDAAIVDIVADMPDLRVLYLMGNPVVKNIRNYRKTLISRCKNLRYLDDRPVFEEERRRVDAWGKVLAEGGTLDQAQEAERLELQLIRKEKDDADERNFRAFEQMMREGQEIRRLREVEEAVAAGLPLPPAPGQPRTNQFTGEAIIPVPESESLRLAREQRWGLCPPPPPASEAVAMKADGIPEEKEESANVIVRTKLAIAEIDEDVEETETSRPKFFDLLSTASAVTQPTIAVDTVKPAVEEADMFALD